MLGAREADQPPADGVTVPAVRGISEHPLDGMFPDDREEPDEEIGGTTLAAARIRVRGAVEPGEEHVLIFLGEVPERPAVARDGQPVELDDTAPVDWLEFRAEASDRPVDVVDDPRLTGTRTRGIARKHARRDRLDGSRLELIEEEQRRHRAGPRWRAITPCA